MKSRRIQNIYLISLVGMHIMACKEPFYPKNVEGNPGFLVVDGNLNAGADSSFIRLTRTASLNDSATITELHATVNVSDGNGGVFPLSEIGNGYYGAAHLNLIQGSTYTLNIKSYDGRLYSSDTFPVLRSPDIDSVSWRQDSVGVSIYAYTHDPANQTKYYRWDYVETWRYDEGLESIFDWDGTKIKLRLRQDQIYSCWSTHNSTNLILATTENLVTDTVNHQLIAEVPVSSEKISVRYSILVRQYALTKGAFEYWQNLKTNTELTGSLFDPLPSQVTGNLHCLSAPSEIVLGYISASTVTRNRIFIGRPEVGSWYYKPYWIDCVQQGSLRISIDPHDPENIPKINNYVLGPDHLYTIVDITSAGVLILAQNYCADCREHGGTNQQPAFWQ